MEKENNSRGATQATVTIKSIIPHPTKRLVDAEEIEPYGDKLRA